MSDGGRDEVRGAVWSHVAVKWCGDATWVNDQQITDNDAAIQKQRNTAFRKDRRRNKNKKKTKSQAAFCLSPRESSFEVVCFRDWVGGAEHGWHVSRDLVLCTFFVPKHRTITKHNRTKRLNDLIDFLSLFFAYLCSFPSSFDFYESQSCSILMSLIAVWNDFWDTVRPLGSESVTADEFIFYLLLFNSVNKSPSTFYRLSFCRCLIERTALLWGGENVILSVFVGPQPSATYCVQHGGSCDLPPVPALLICYFLLSSNNAAKQSCKTCGLNKPIQGRWLNDWCSLPQMNAVISSETLVMDCTFAWWKQVADTTFSAADLVGEGRDSNQQIRLLFLVVLVLL